MCDRWLSFAAASHRRERCLFVVHSTVSYASLTLSSQLRGYRVVPKIEQRDAKPSYLKHKTQQILLWSLFVIAVSQISAPVITLGTANVSLESKMKRKEQPADV